MDDETILLLRHALSLGLIVWWMSDNGVGKQITRIATHGDEPGPVAYLCNTAIGADYIALYNVTRDEIMVTSTDLLPSGLPKP